MDVADLKRVMRQYFDGKQRNTNGMLSLGAAIRAMNFTTNPTPVRRPTGRRRVTLAS